MHGENANLEPVHPAYANNPNLPSIQIRNAAAAADSGPVEGIGGMGDPKKLVDHLYKITLQSEIPTHLPFGGEVIPLYKQRSQLYAANSETAAKYPI